MQKSEFQSLISFVNRIKSCGLIRNIELIYQNKIGIFVLYRLDFLHKNASSILKIKNRKCAENDLKSQVCSSMHCIPFFCQFGTFLNLQIYIHITLSL